MAGTSAGIGIDTCLGIGVSAGIRIGVDSGIDIGTGIGTGISLGKGIGIGIIVIVCPSLRSLRSICFDNTWLWRVAACLARCSSS